MPDETAFSKAVGAARAGAVKTIGSGAGQGGTTIFGETSLAGVMEADPQLDPQRVLAITTQSVLRLVWNRSSAAFGVCSRSPIIGLLRGFIGAGVTIRLAIGCGRFFRDARFGR
jgi:hypothetical protein